MTETAAIQADRAELLLQRRREDQQQMIANFRARLPVTVVLVLAGAAEDHLAALAAHHVRRYPARRHEPDFRTRVRRGSLRRAR